jgi:uncharacterized DUF497 family protein
MNGTKIKELATLKNTDLILLMSNIFLKKSDNITIAASGKHGEKRFVMYSVFESDIVIIVFTYRVENTRIISFRKASSKERRQYYDSKNDK